MADNLQQSFLPRSRCEKVLFYFKVPYCKMSDFHVFFNSRYRCYINTARVSKRQVHREMHAVHIQSHQPHQKLYLSRSCQDLREVVMSQLHSILPLTFPSSQSQWVFG